MQGDPEILNALAGRQALRAKSKQQKQALEAHPVAP